MAFGCKNGVDLNIALKCTISFLLHTKMISQNDAINLEVRLVTKHAVRKNKISHLKDILLPIFRYDFFSQKYKSHLNKRKLENSSCINIILDSSNDEPIAECTQLHCISCGSNKAKLQVKWQENNSGIELPNYYVNCCECGFEKEFDFYKQLVHDGLILSSELT